MRYKLLGPSALRVSEVCLGTMTFGTDWGVGADEAEAGNIYAAYREAGGNFLDTANMYTNGTSERFLGKLVAKEREEVVIGTKYTLSTRPGDPNASGNHAKNMRQAIDASLKRMGLEYIDLLWVHIWDRTVHPEELMRNLHLLVQSGKVLHLGISDTPAWVVAQCNTIAQHRGWTPFTALQIEYSLLERTPERDLLPMAEAFGLAVTPWSPLGAGMLTGKYRQGQEIPKGLRLSESSVKLQQPRNYTIAEAVVQWSEKLGTSPAAVALSWVRQQGRLQIPILGVRNVAQLKDNLGTLAVTLPEEALAELGEVSKVELGFPHQFMDLPFVRARVYSDKYDDIDFR
jgi:aryl-alcohol dehydrogenase-like predicted oxidoreductase